MSKRKWMVVVGFGALGLMAIALAGAPEQIAIEKCGTKKAAVEFDHAAHVALDDNCVTCHHNQEDLTAEAGTGQKCRDCHFEPTEEGALDCSQMSPAKNPYHVSCVGCHKTTVKADPTVTAPTKCDNCHPKT